jgi:hypothetical protein
MKSPSLFFDAPFIWAVWLSGSVVKACCSAPINGIIFAVSQNLKGRFFMQALERLYDPGFGERNVIVHNYGNIDDRVVFESVAEAVELYQQYVKCVSRHLHKA